METTKFSVASSLKKRYIRIAPILFFLYVINFLDQGKYTFDYKQISPARIVAINSKNFT